MSWNDLLKPCKTELKLTFFDSVNLINKDDWLKITAQKNIYLSLPYLRAVEESLKDSISFRYVLFYNDEYKPVAAAYIQVLNFEDKGNQFSNMLSNFGEKVKEKILSLLDFKVLVCGNVFGTGENGFVYDDSISDDDAFNHLSRALYRLRRSSRVDSDVSITLVKDFWPKSVSKSDYLLKADFKDFEVDVNMVLNIDENWNSLDDYLASMKTKFRTKAKASLTRSNNLVIKNFNSSDIGSFSKQIDLLFGQVIEKADYKFGMLNARCFELLKQELKNHFVFKAYFLNERMVGFSAAIVCNDYIDANYVGIDYSVNKEHGLYQRMLYDYTELAILRKTKSLRFGRTAEQIKSSLGAIPVGMRLYVKHKNLITNKLIKPVIDRVKPSEFELRKPFKSTYLNK